jgi:hypothetical protein
MDVFQWELTMDSVKKNTVAATIAKDPIQTEIATGSCGLRNPFKCVPVQNICDLQPGTLSGLQ